MVWNLRVTAFQAASTVAFYKPEPEGVFFGANALNMVNEKGEIEESYSIAAGLDFPSVGPQHCYLQSIGRAQYVGATDVEALQAFMLLSLEEGIIPALESSHALAYAINWPKCIRNKSRNLLLIYRAGVIRIFSKCMSALKKKGFSPTDT